MSCDFRWYGNRALIKAESSSDAVDLLKQKRSGAIEGWAPATGWLELATHDGEKIVWNHEAIKRHLEARRR